MQVETISVTKEQALEKLAEYTRAQRIKTTKDQQLLRRLYKELARGKKVLDIYEAFKQAGVLGDSKLPRLAIARVNWHRVAFERSTRWVGNETAGDGSGTFRPAASWRDRGSPRFFVNLPAGTFPSPWPKVEVPGQDPVPAVHEAETLVPVVPLEKQPPNPDTEEYPYFVLFEVDKWEPRAPRDPYLLRRVTPNLFVIEAKWATTKLERAFVNGRLATR